MWVTSDEISGAPKASIKNFKFRLLSLLRLSGTGSIDDSLVDEFGNRFTYNQCAFIFT